MNILFEAMSIVTIILLFFVSSYFFFKWKEVQHLLGEVCRFGKVKLTVKGNGYEMVRKKEDGKVNYERKF